MIVGTELCYNVCRFFICIAIVDSELCLYINMLEVCTPNKT